MSDFVVNKDKSEINIGESVTFVVNYYGQTESGMRFNIYANNNLIYTTYNTWFQYTHTFTNSGEYDVIVQCVDNYDGYVFDSASFGVITVNRPPTPTGSWSINNKTVKSLMKDGKEIIKIERVEDGKILYEKESNNYVVATVTGNSIILGESQHHWLLSTDDVVIDWGDGLTDTVNNPTTSLTHDYTDGVNNHDITFMGEVISLGDGCFGSCAVLTSVTIPDSVTSLGDDCFKYCFGLTSVTIPDSVTSIGMNCFAGCHVLVDYQLYWTGNNIITYNRMYMANNTNTVFTIPNGETANYISKGYPSNKLVERN